jgi:hypothetical protein
MALSERKIPDDWDAANLTDVQMLLATATLLDRLDDATDEYLAANGSEHRVDRQMQESLRRIASQL